MAGRPLFPAEMEIAFRGFKATLPYHKIFISPLSGLQSLPFTTTIPPLVAGPLAAGYSINVGLDGFLHGMDRTIPAFTLWIPRGCTSRSRPRRRRARSPRLLLDSSPRHESAWRR